MKAFASFSGGKESTLSCYRATKLGINISYLVNMTSCDGRYCRSHGISSEVLRIQAESIGIPLIQRKTSWRNYEEGFKKVISRVKKEGVEAGVFGDIDLQEHRDWVERVCSEVGIKPILPLWDEEREQILKEFIEVGFKAVIVATKADFLGKEWLGRRIDEKFVEGLKTLGIDLCGEEGEYHTFVFDGPLFRKPIRIIPGKKVLRDNHWFLEIVPEGVRR